MTKNKYSCENDEIAKLCPKMMADNIRIQSVNLRWVAINNFSIIVGVVDVDVVATKILWQIDEYFLEFLDHLFVNEWFDRWNMEKVAVNYFVTFFDESDESKRPNIFFSQSKFWYNKRETTYCTSKWCFIYAEWISINRIKKTLTQMLSGETENKKMN